MSIKGVVFDWAGTIIDFGSLAPMGAFVKLFQRHGVHITVEQARVPMGLPKLEHIRALGGMPDVAQSWRASHHGLDFTDEDAVTLLKEFEPMSAASAWEHRFFIPGFLQAYWWMKSKGMRSATTTGYTRNIMTPIISHAESMGFEPDLVICCDDVIKSRPDPMGMFACCDAMGLKPGHQVVKVDDTAPGIEEALNANCLAIGVAASGNALGWSELEWRSASADQRKKALESAEKSLIKAGAHLVIPTVADLPRAIQMLSNTGR